jgi:hypothetical protein
MTILEKAVSKMQQLPIDRQQQVLKFIEFLTFDLGDRQVDQETENLTAKKTRSSRRDLLKKWEGVVEGGVDDLSYNKKYMEGYGQK